MSTCLSPQLDVFLKTTYCSLTNSHIVTILIVVTTIFLYSSLTTNTVVVLCNIYREREFPILYLGYQFLSAVKIDLQI